MGRRARVRADRNNCGRLTRTYPLTFRGGETALLAVIGNGDSDLDVSVYNEDGNCVAADNDDTDDCIVAWIPAQTGKFTLKVVDQGSMSNRYEIGTN